MGMFDDFDIASAADDPFNLSDGTYKGAISKVQLVEGVTPAKDGKPAKDYKAVVVTLSNEDGRSYQHWLRSPMSDDTDTVKGFKLSAIKTFYKGLEIPVDRMNTVESSDLTGTDIVFTISTNKKGYRDAVVQLPHGTPVKKYTASSSLDYSL